jgi:carboxypeptidase C (cathepsin A)
LEEYLPAVENFTLNKLIPALSRGNSLSDKKKEELAHQMSIYTGISEKVYIQHNLDLPTSYFWKELLRDSIGMTIGRLDSRYLGIDKREAGSYPEYSPELTSWLHSFTPAINSYLKEDLGYKTDLKYNMFGDVYPWDKTKNNTRNQLRRAMAQNPHLNVMYQTGYFDGATTYFNSKYSMWQLDPSGKMTDRISFHAYESGHMMYLRKQDLELASKDLRSFILKNANPNQSATYREDLKSKE